MIKLKNINKTFIKDGQALKAVSGVELTVEKQDIFGIIGFSGAGKSTLVRCINLLETPDEGASVVVDGVELTGLSPRELRAERAKISMIFQSFNLMPSRTVLDNVTYPLCYKGISRKDRAARARALLKLVGLEDREGNYPAELSGGQKQRVAIARALASEPKVLLCDEATSALDPQTTKEILALLKDLNRTLGLTIVIITHEMAVVKEICNKVAIMERGRVVETGSVFSIFTNPRQKISESFVRSASNLSKAELLLTDHRDLLNINPGESLVRLRYRGPGISEPLISTISSRYNLVLNILFADVELVAGYPVGGTVGVISGAAEDIQQAYAFLRAKNVQVEELYHA